MPEICARFVDCHVFRRRDGHEEWLMMLRAPHIMLGGTWQMVSGTMEPGETAYAAAARELREETGLLPLHFYQASYVNRFYLAATDQIILSPVFAAEVAAHAEVVLSGEHTEYLWVPWEEAMRRLPWPGQRESLAIIREQFLAREPLAASRLDHLVECLAPSDAVKQAGRPAAAR
ncbi:MAG TPA: NUDIX domain-containing protein [Candidatus Thermoplasmatota archaeon]|nr:NUDIX domain-containing protein [Candidatus Thermoplasmatota archaeon]